VVLAAIETHTRRTAGGGAAGAPGVARPVPAGVGTDGD